jgi:hypothetical protein
MPDPWTACDELFRVLKPGGLYVGSTTFLYPFHERSYYNMTHLGVRHMLEKSGFVVEKILPWRISGLEALVRVLFVGRVLKQFASSIARLEFKLIMSLRRIGAKLAARIYSKNERKSQRASQFMDEEPMRFTSGFIYLARKPGSPESIE